MKLNIKELKNIIGYILHNNNQLVEQGKKPTTVEIKGESGIGKTSMIIQLAKELNKDFVKINLTQVEELGDLVGYPITEYNLTSPTGDVIWSPEKVLDNYLKSGFTVNTDVEPRMSYAPPAWLPKGDNDNGGILLLDDFNRADKNK